jgi:hypothetical protein
MQDRAIFHFPQQIFFSASRQFSTPPLKNAGSGDYSFPPANFSFSASRCKSGNFQPPLKKMQDRAIFHFPQQIFLLQQAGVNRAIFTPPQRNAGSGDFSFPPANFFFSKPAIFNPPSKKCRNRLLPVSRVTASRCTKSAGQQSISSSVNNENFLAMSSLRYWVRNGTF